MYRQTGSPQLQKFNRSSSYHSCSDDERKAQGKQKVNSESFLPPNSEAGLNTLHSVHVNDAFQVDESDKSVADKINGGTCTQNEKKAPSPLVGKRDFRSFKRKWKEWLKTRAGRIRKAITVVAFLLYNIYLGIAIHLTWSKTESFCDGVRFLVLITSATYLCVIFKLLVKPHAQQFVSTYPVFVQITSKVTKFRHVGKVSWTIAWTSLMIFLIVDTSGNRYRLVSVAGLGVLLLLGYAFSEHPNHVRWHQVQCGVMTQFVFGLIILRWQVGRTLFQCLGNKMKAFLDFTDAGSSFVFGYLVSGKMTDVHLQQPVFAFKVLCTIFYFSFLVSMLYYYGVMQAVVMNLGWLLQKTIGTTACESINAASNIFLGMTEAPLLIRPYLPRMTKSELHTVLTGGFATIAGSVMAAYISFGINASHLLSASVMSAPAALAFSKLMYPETEVSSTTAEDIKVEKPQEANALEAASNGAVTAVTMVSNIVANLVAFMAFIAFLDSLTTWFGGLVDWEFLNFEWLMSKIFVPLSLIMGVQWEDKEKVANLVGLKTVVNEFVAYKKLSDYQMESSLSKRSEAIVTFALCGFSNFGSIGIQLGSLGALAPERKSDLASIALRAMISGSAACFMTACIAGTLLTDIE